VSEEGAASLTLLARRGDGLTARLLERDLRLARTTQPGEQLRLLGDMAGDLRTEAVQLARQGAREDAALVAGLYGRVVRRGVVGRALVLPPQQAQVRDALRLLQEAEDEIDEHDGTTAVALRPLGEAARDARQRKIG